jgi:acetylornithine deacetylase
VSRTLDILDRLVGFDTVSARSNLALVEHVEDLLATAGFAVTRIPDAGEDKAGLYAEIGPPGQGVLLSAHSDVVPVAGQHWTRPPFALTREGDRLYGRGTTDMKGFVAAMLAAAEAAGTMTLREPLKLVLSYDEEVGCVGIARMMDRLIPLIGRPRMALVGEPTEMRVGIGHKGKRAYRAVIGGEAGHSALAPHFVNALHVAADLVQALRALQTELECSGARDAAHDVPFSTLHVGELSGGRALNIVPDHAEMALELRHLAQDDPDALERRIRAEAARICAAHGAPARVEIEPLTRYPGLDTPAEAPVVAEAMRLARTDTTKVAFGTEAGFFAALGIPTVVCGPGSMAAQGHKADEYLAVSQLEASRAMLDRLLEDLSA